MRASAAADTIDCLGPPIPIPKTETWVDVPTLDPTGLFEEIPTTLVEEQQLLMVATASTPAQSNERTLDVFIIVFSSRASYVRYKLRVQKKMWKPIALPNYQASRIALVVDKTIDTTPEDNIKSQYPL